MAPMDSEPGRREPQGDTSSQPGGGPAAYLQPPLRDERQLAEPWGLRRRKALGPWGPRGGLARMKVRGLQSRLHNVWTNLTSDTIEF